MIFIEGNKCWKAGLNYNWIKLFPINTKGSNLHSLDQKWFSGLGVRFLLWSLKFSRLSILLPLRFASQNRKTVGIPFHQWLSGLGVWFSLWVREVPGSNPGWALIFCSPGKNTTFRGHTDLNHISPIQYIWTWFTSDIVVVLRSLCHPIVPLIWHLGVKSHQLLSCARAPLGPRRDAGVSKGPAEGPSFIAQVGAKIF